MQKVFVRNLSCDAYFRNQNLSASQGIRPKFRYPRNQRNSLNRFQVFQIEKIAHTKKLWRFLIPEFKLFRSFQNVPKFWFDTWSSIGQFMSKFYVKSFMLDFSVYFSMIWRWIQKQLATWTCVRTIHVRVDRHASQHGTGKMPDISATEVSTVEVNINSS